MTADKKPQEQQSPPNELFEFIKKTRAEGREAVATAVPALDRLCEIMRNRTGQSYKVRALLWSLYNSKPTSLLEVVAIDRPIRKDLCAVVMAFGFEADSGSFFYAEMKRAIAATGQWNWFVEQSEVEE